MPIYEYRCEKCGHEFSRVETMSAHEQTRVSCPQCKSPGVARVLTAFYAKTVRKS